MAFLLIDFRPLKATFEKMFIFPTLGKHLNHDAIQTEALILKNPLARDVLFLRGSALSNETSDTAFLLYRILLPYGKVFVH